MSNDELFELVAVLTAKNMALEERIKEYDKQLDIAVKKLNDCNNDGEEFDFDYDEDDSDYYPPHPGYVPGDPVGEELRELIEGDDDDSDWNYPNHYSDPKSVEVDLLHKISALESKVVELGESIWKRISRLEASYSLMNGKVYSFGLDISKLKSILIEEEEDNG